MSDSLDGRLKQAAFGEMGEGGRVTKIADEFLRAAQEWVAEAARDTVEITEEQFADFLEYGEKHGESWVIEALSARKDLSQEWVSILFDIAIENLDPVVSGVGMDEARQVISNLARGGYLQKFEIERLLAECSGRSAITGYESWVVQVLGRARLDKGQILKTVTHPDIPTNASWAVIAKQEEADDEVWETMVGEIPINSNQTFMGDRHTYETLGLLWGYILSHPKNRGLDKWYKKWEATKDSLRDITRGRMAAIMLRQEDLEAVWDVDELVEWYMKGGVVIGGIIEQWPGEIINRIGPRGKALMLRSVDKDVRVSVIKMIGGMGAQKRGGGRAL